MTEGYVYCLSNISIPGLVKVGMTERTPEERVLELFTTGVATPFKVEFAKKVINPKQKECDVHVILKKYRVNPKREFFRISPEEVKKFFSLMDGDWWTVEKPKVNKESKSTQILPNGCRKAPACFVNEQEIRHIIPATNTQPPTTWIGRYDSSKNGIMCNGILYQGRSPLNQFAKSHYEIERNDRVYNVNAWVACECEVNGKWVSTFNLPEIYETDQNNRSPKIGEIYIGRWFDGKKKHLEGVVKRVSANKLLLNLTKKYNKFNIGEDMSVFTKNSHFINDAEPTNWLRIGRWR